MEGQSVAFRIQKKPHIPYLLTDQFFVLKHVTPGLDDFIKWHAYILTGKIQ